MEFKVISLSLSLSLRLLIQLGQCDVHALKWRRVALKRGSKCWRVMSGLGAVRVASSWLQNNGMDPRTWQQMRRKIGQHVSGNPCTLYMLNGLSHAHLHN